MTIPLIFDRARALALRQKPLKETFLWDEAAAGLADRLCDIKPVFADVAVLGRAPSALLSACAARPGAQRITHMADVDEEATGLTPGLFDLVVSCFGFHCVNDVPGALSQIQSSLKPGGAFLAVFLGGDSLIELRTALLDGEVLATGGASPRVAPMIGAGDFSMLMTRAGFHDPVVDIERMNVTYTDMLKLCRDLRAMNLGNVLAARARHFTRRSVFAAASTRYAELFMNEQGRVRATFEMVYAIGWKQ